MTGRIESLPPNAKLVLDTLIFELLVQVPGMLEALGSKEAIIRGGRELVEMDAIRIVENNESFSLKITASGMAAFGPLVKPE